MGVCMARVAVERVIDEDPERLQSAIADVGPFLRAAGFDAVTVDGGEVTIENHVGLLTIELACRLVDDPDALLAYEQVEGLFEEMRTRYAVESGPGGSVTVTGETTYALDAGFVGPLLDATVVGRQRRRELAAQFDYLEAL